MSEYSKEFLEQLILVESERDLLEAVDTGKFAIADKLPELSEETRKRVVAVTQPTQFANNLQFSSFDTTFTRTYSDWMSRFSMLNELFMLRPFSKQIIEDGFLPLLHFNTADLLENSVRWENKLKIEDFQLPRESELYRYQNYTLNRALEKARKTTVEERFFFWNWGTGCGKSAICVAGAQELFNRDEIDLVFAFTKGSLKPSLRRFFTTTSILNAVVNEGGKSLLREKRHQNYSDPSVQVFVLNYEKALWDFEPIHMAIRGKRVLWVFDEVQMILTSDEQNTYRQGIDKLISSTRKSIIWPMSASIIEDSPLQFRDVFTLGRATINPLGTEEEFTKKYKKGVERFKIKTKRGGYFYVETIKWDNYKLHEVRHLVCDRTQTIRKTDPEVRDNFKDMRTDPFYIQMSREDRKIYDYIKELASEAREEERDPRPYIRLLRIVCNTPEGFAHTTGELAAHIVETFPKLITSKNSAKMEAFVDQVDSIRAAGDKVVAFTQWTHLSLFRIEPLLKRRGINYVAHHGEMTLDEQDTAQMKFKEDENVTLFLSSDAGKYGLNFPEARFVINYECPHSYSTLMQRGERINRADSYLDGLTSYVYITEDTLEEGIWRENNRRRELAAATSGTNEVLSYGDTLVEDRDTLNPQQAFDLIFGQS